MAGISDQLASLNKRVGALERQDGQKETIIPLIIKQYQTFQITPIFCATNIYVSASDTIACGDVNGVATNFIEFSNYGVIGDGLFANVGQVASTGFDDELFRKVSTGAESLDDVFVVDVFIEENEANGNTYTNSALLFQGDETAGTGTIIAKNTDFSITKTTENTLTISTEIKFEVI
jgi:hypothetical protein